MLSLGIGSSWCLTLVLAAAVPSNAPQAPGLEVLRGKPRVFAGEAWLQLAPGASLPKPQAQTSLSLGADSAVRVSRPGAAVELRGPLEVDSHASQAWSLRLEGSGRVHIDARSTRLQVELPGAAWVEFGHGIAWIEGLPEGGWRVGCDAGEPLRLRPPPGVRWGGVARLAPGEVLRVVPAHVLPPSRPPFNSGPARAWGSFSWPWNVPTIAEAGAGWGGLEHAAVLAAARALAALCAARCLGH